MEQDKITLIKKDAIIPLSVGSNFIHRIQQALLFFTDDKTDEEMESFNRALLEGTPLEGWMVHVETLILLMRGIEESAINNGMTVEQDITT